MFNKLMMIPFYLGIVMGTLMVCSASSWMTCWLGLEVNLMSFIPLLLNKMSAFSTEASIKYFITQALGSMIIMFSAILININTQSNSLMNINEIAIVALAIKMGLAPFHMWFPQVVELTEWAQTTILMTWQKIAPSITLSFNLSILSSFLIIMSALIGMAGGFNQNSIKKILTYSSIAHLAWMYSIIMINEKAWWIYLAVYSMLLILTIVPLYKFNIKSINKLNSTPSSSNLKASFFMNFLSIAGMTPLVGVMPKVMVIMSILSGAWVNKMIIMSTLIVTSLVTLFYYLKMFYSSMIMFNFLNPLKIKSIPLSKGLNNIMAVSLIGNLILIPLVLLTQ